MSTTLPEDLEERPFDIQASDTTDLQTAVENVVAKKRRRRERKSDLDIEATVRELVDAIQNVLAVSPEAATKLLDELHYTLRLDDDIGRITDPRDDLLQRDGGAELDDTGAKKTRALWRRHCRLRDGDGTPPDPEKEFVVASNVAKALGYFRSVTDLTPYAPVTLEPINEPGHKSDDQLRPVGRRRLKKGTTMTTEEASVEIPHESCDHILAVALPRRGKDSTLTSIGKNLYEQHGYKYFSIYDDGRMETPMLAIPNGEDVIHENLSRLDQDPDPFNAEVMCPAVNLPDQLPANFREFTFGIDDLTPWTLLKLGGVNGDRSTESRINDALEETLSKSGTVPDLVSRLKAKAEKLDSTITWTEKRERGSGSSVETYETTCEMGVDRALKKAANQVARLAGKGLIAGRDASTNVDMAEVIQDRETATVLCCNFLGSGMEAIKYLIIDLWLQLIYQTVDHNARLPRVCLEIRELKRLAPSKNADVKWQDAVKDLKQTLFFLSTQGGSRRILMLASTQKLNDIYKPIRTNMATKILLQLGEEEIDTLDKSYNFSHKMKRQLKEFGKGKGMVLSSNGAAWPIEWRGAPCGLGDGDRHWLDQYGTAFGARVREVQDNYWQRKHSDAEWWVHVLDGRVYPMDSPPEIEDFYSWWHLLSTDFPDDVDVADGHIPEGTIREALAERRPHELKTDLMLRGVDTSEMKRQILTQPQGEVAENHKLNVAEYYEIPPEIRGWLDVGESKRKKFIATVEAVDKHDPKDLPTLTDIHKRVELPEGESMARGSFGTYVADKNELRPCLTQDGAENYILTDIGKKAVEIDWDEAIEKLEAK